MHIVVVKQTPDDRVEVVGTQSVEWRRVLLSGYLSITVELTGMGGDTAVAVGTLTLQLELLPKAANTLVNDAALSAQIRGEREQDADRDRRFFNAAKSWWKEYLQIRPEHAGRMVKIFARTESDVNMPVCAFVRPLQVTLKKNPLKEPRDTQKGPTDAGTPAGWAHAAVGRGGGEVRGSDRVRAPADSRRDSRAIRGLGRPPHSAGEPEGRR